VLTTYRLTEHHTAGGMSRTLPYLSELQPELFVEVSPSSPRARASSTRLGDDRDAARGVEARVMVTDRCGRCASRAAVHQVGLPYHWGRSGLVTGDAANELSPLVLDLNVHIASTRSRPATSARAAAARRGADRARRGLPARGRAAESRA
jgi:formate dehydrogenase major subunit